MDGHGFSLCAVPLESSGPGFRGVAEVRGMSGGLGYPGPEFVRGDFRK